MRSQHSISANSLLILFLLAGFTLLAGCSNGKLRSTPSRNTGTPWFCEMNELRDNWDCVQDEELARHPQPKRLPGDDQDVSAVSLESDSNGALMLGTAQVATNLLDLPGNLFVVQLANLESADLANAFVATHQLDGAIPLELAAQGELYYVVLLGIYDSFTAAEAAIAARPESLAETKPWVRPLASIQTDLRAAAGEIAGPDQLPPSS